MEDDGAIMDVRHTMTVCASLSRGASADRLAHLAQERRSRNRDSYALKMTLLSDELLYAENDDLEDDQARHTGRRFVLREDSRARLIWSAIIMVALIYASTIFLYRLSFLSLHIGPNGLDPISKDNVLWLIADTILTVIFWIDLFLNFFISYQDSKGNEVDDLKLIACRYIRFHFWINLLACLPEVVFSFASDSSPLQAHRSQHIWKLARLVRIPCLAQFLDTAAASPLWTSLMTAYRKARVVNFLVCLVWVLHMLASGWYLVAAMQVDLSHTWVARSDTDSSEAFLEQTPYDHWSVSITWVFCMLFMCMGIEDIAASTTIERAYIMMTMLLGAVVGGIIIGGVASALTSKGETQQAIERQVHLIETYSAHTGLDQPTVASLKAEITRRVKHDIQRSYDKADIQDMLTSKYMPAWLLMRIPGKLFGGKLLANDMLRSMLMEPPLLPALLAMHLLRMEFDAGEVVYQLHDLPVSLFLVLTGTFACVGIPGEHGGSDAIQEEGSWADSLDERPSMVTSATSEAPSQCLHPYRLFSSGSYFGDTDLIVGRLRCATVRCERKGATLALNKPDFLELQNMFPQFGALCASAARRRTTFRINALARLRMGLPLRHFAALTIQNHFRHILPQRRRSIVRAHNAQMEVIASAVTVHVRTLGMLSKPGVTTNGDLRREVANLRSDISAFKGELCTKANGELHRELADLRSEFSDLRDEVRFLLQPTPRLEHIA